MITTMIKTKLIHHQLLVVDDLDTTKEFYGRVLGMTEIKRPSTGRTGLWYGCLSNELHISVRDGIKRRPKGPSLQPGEREGREGRHVAFTMDGSLDDIAALLEAEGVPFARGTLGLPQIFCEDPSGNLIELNTGWSQEPLE